MLTGAAALVVHSARQPAPVAGQGESLSGTWMEDATLPNGQPTVTIVTFISDGSLVMTSDQHLVRTPAHGAWAQTGDRRYAWTWWRLAFDANGSYIEKQRMHGELTLNDARDEYSSEHTVETYDPQGNLLRSNAISSQGHRVQIDM